MRTYRQAQARVRKERKVCDDTDLEEWKDLRPNAKAENKEYFRLTKPLFNEFKPANQRLATDI